MSLKPLPKQLSFPSCHHTAPVSRLAKAPVQRLQLQVKAVASVASSIPGTRTAVCRDPANFLQGMPRPDNQVLALAFDLGTSAGYAGAFIPPGRSIEVSQLRMFCGQIDLSVGNYDSRGIIPVRLRAFLNQAKPDIVFFEQVKQTAPFGPNKAAMMARSASLAEFFGGLMMAIADWAHVTETPCIGIPIGTIKKRATGKGNASKEDVMTALNATFGTQLDVTKYESTGEDNIADAGWCLVAGLETYAPGVLAECGKAKRNTGEGDLGR